MKRRGNVISPIDTVNTLVEMLIQTDTSVEDGETVWVRSELTLFVYRTGTTLVPDGLTIFASLYGNPAGVWQRLDVGSSASPQFYARGVGPNANVASLAAFTVAGNDGITYAQGDVVLLAAQTTAAENGPYVVGLVTTGTAPLVRPAWWATGAVLKTGTTITLGGEGTNWKNTIWQSMRAAASFIVGTNDPTMYPQRFTRQVVLASAASVIANLPILSTESGVDITRCVQGGATTTVQYAATLANGTQGITPGTLATGSLTISPQLLAGTAAAVDTSTVNVTVFNQAG